jgi:RHS repeat-associated protein
MKTTYSFGQDSLRTEQLDQEQDPSRAPLCSPAACSRPRVLAHGWTGHTARLFFCAAFLLAFLCGPVRGEEKTFTIQNIALTLEEVTGEVEVFFRSMRLNRALNVWNVEVTVTNRGTRLLPAPLVLLVDDFSGTSGVLNPDGTDDSTPAKAFFDLSGQSTALAPGTGTAPRTLSLGFSGASPAPRLVTRVFALTSGERAVAALTRALDDAGHPLEEVQVEETGPEGTRSFTVDRSSGWMTLGQDAGLNRWRFSKPGYTTVWRENALETGVHLLPHPRLTARSRNAVPVTPLNGGTVSARGIQIVFGPGAVSQSSSMKVTPLTTQTLPALLPLGWSPLQAFWLEAAVEPVQEGLAALQLWDLLGSGEIAALVLWNESVFRWDVVALFPGNDTRSLAVPIARSGAYAIVAPDDSPAPPSAVPGEGLRASDAVPPEPGSLSAEGVVNPSSSPASTNPELVTGEATVTISHSSGPLASGLILRGEVTESYRLRDGTERTLPRYETSLIGYRRPGDRNPARLHAVFQMRPLRLFGADELDEAIVRMDVSSPGPFAGTVLSISGGQIAAEDIRLLGGAGVVDRPQAATLRKLDPALFGDFSGESAEIVAAFELNIGGIVSGRRLIPQFGFQSSNGFFVLARVLVHDGVAGLEPLERFSSDATGRLSSVEPASSDRLPGITGAGQYVLVRIPEAHGIVIGVARNAQGAAAPGLLVTISGEPWMTFSAGDGSYQLIAPAGLVRAAVQDLITGDIGELTGTLASPQAVLALDLTSVPSGPRVTAVSPEDGARNVSRVAPIVVSFSEPVNPGSVLGGIQLLGTNGQPVSGNLTLNLRNTAVTFLPSTQLAANAGYRLTLARTITDLSGRALEGSNEFTFTTAHEAVRGSGGQLTIYEPGARNIPPEILANLVGYDPDADREATVVHGGHGAADPEVPVILMNESTGETATVLSKPDGSFYGFIRADIDDFISSTILNENGSRIYLPVSKQLFDNGFVGLYKQGGILEAESDGGPVQVLIEPGAIPGKTKFKIESLTLAQVLQELRNAVPETGQLLGGFRYSIEGDELEQSADISFPIDPATLDLEPGESAEDRGFALCRAIEVDGETVYEILDKMEYQDGRLVTRSPPFPGPPHLSFLALPVMMSFGVTTVIVGTVVGVPEEAGFPTETEIMAGVMANGTPVRRIGGAVVSASPGAPAVGPLRRGAYVCRANSLGFFSFMYPINQVDPNAVLLRAQDVRAPGLYGFRALPALGAFAGPFAGQSANIVLRYPAGSAGDLTPPVLTAFPPVAVLPVNTNINIPFLLRDNLSDPVLDAVTFQPAESFSLLTGMALSNNAVTVTLGSVSNLGPGRILVPVEFNATESALVVVQADYRDTAGNTNSSRLRFRFGAPPETNPGNLKPGDPQDKQPPKVVSVNPQTQVPVTQPQLWVRFNEPVDRIITNAASSVSISPQVETRVDISPEQQEIVIYFRSLEPGTAYTVTLNPSEVKDLSGNQMEASYTITFQTPQSTSANLAGLTSAVGSVVLGSYSFTLNRIGNEGELVSHQVGYDAQTAAKGRVRLPFFPRTLEVIPEYSFRRTTNGPVETKPLVVVSGGVVGSETIGQLLWVIDVSDPDNPKRLASEVAEVDPAAIITKIKWSPPNLLLSQMRPDFPILQMVNLQAFIIGAHGQTAVAYKPGRDLNGDGDYVDPGEEVPVPERNTLFGLEVVLPLEEKKILNDFDGDSGGAFMVAVTRTAGSPDSELQVILFNGQPISLPGATNGIVKFPGKQARRVALDMAFPVATPMGTRIIPVAIVAVDSAILIYELTNPDLPVLLNTLQLEPNAETIFTLARSGADEYVVGTRDGVYVLQRSLMSLPLDTASVSPAVVERHEGVIFGRTFGATDLEIVSSNGSQARMINRPPRIRVVQFASRPVISAESLLQAGEEKIRDYLNQAEESPFLLPVAYDPCNTNSISSLGEKGGTPNPAVHHYALIRANGMAGPTLNVSVESLDFTGRLNTPKGKDNLAVILTSRTASLGINSVHPTVTPLKARRLSNNPISELYNTYITDSFVLIRHRLTAEQRTVLTNNLKRQGLWSGDFARLAIDPLPNGDPALAVWVSGITNSVYMPNVSRSYLSLRAEFVDSPNPSFARATPKLGGGVDMQSGEFRHPETDIYIEGREQDIVLTRVYESRSHYVGLFGRGWDFNLNARLLELREEILPVGFSIPVGARGTNCLDSIPGDVILFDGAGGVHRFRKISDANGNLGEKAAYSTDPAIAEFFGLNGGDVIGTFYESPPGLYTILLKFVDGTFMTVGPLGHRMFFDATGRLTKMRARSPKSEVLFSYREDGKLSAVTGDRDADLEFGYYLRFPGSDFTINDVASSDPAKLGKIARVRVNPSLVNQSEVTYDYDADGNLSKIAPKIGPETVHQYDANDLHLLIAVGGGDGTQLPGQKINYKDGLVESVVQDGKTRSFSGAKATSRERFEAGPSSVSYNVNGNTATVDVDTSGRPTKFAGKPFEADDEGQPTLVSDGFNEVTLIYDRQNPVYRFRNNLVGTERKAGNGKFVSGFSYDNSAWNRISWTTNVNGVVTSSTYLGNEIREVTGPVTRRVSRNDYHQTTRTEDIEAEILASTFHLGSGNLNPDGALFTGQSAAGLNQTQQSRDHYGRLGSQSQGNYSLTITYNNDGLLERVLGVNAPTIQYTYTEALVETETISAGPQQIVNSYKYDDTSFPSLATEWKTTETGLPNSVTTYNYGSQGLLEEYTVNGDKFELAYSGILLTNLSGPGRSWSAEYDSGRMTSLTEQGITADFTYDSSDRLETIERQGARTVFEYDDVGQTLRTRLKRKRIEEGPGGNVLFGEEYTYDGAGRTRTIVSSGRTKEFSYFADGGLKQMRLNGAIVREIERNSAGLITRSRMNDLEFSYSNFDPNTGAPFAETHVFLAGGRSIQQQNTYFPDGRLQRLTLPNGAYDFEYSGFGHVSLRRDPDQVEEKQSSSPGGSRLSFTFTDGTTAAYTYDNKRRIEQIQTAAGNILYGYDTENLVGQVTWPDGSISKFSKRNDFYEPDEIEHGNIKQSLTWNDGRLEKIEVAATGDTQEYSYDALGRTLSVDLNGEAVEFGYNQFGEPDSETTDAGVWQATMDARSRLTAERYPSGLVLNFAPDDYGFPTSLSAVGIQSMSWISAGRPEEIRFSSGLVVKWSYDSALRKEKIHYIASGITNGFDYELTSGGRLSSELRLPQRRIDLYIRNTPAEGMRITNFYFSATNSLGMGAVAALTNLSFSNGELRGREQGLPNGDPRAFFPEITYSPGVTRRVASAAGHLVHYDSRGSVTDVPVWVRLPGQTQLTAVPAALDYNGLGMIVRVSRGDGVTVEYTRDGLGRIVERSVSGPSDRCTPGERRYVWRGRKLIEEGESSANGLLLLRRYIYLGDHLAVVQSASSPGDPLTDYVPMINYNGSICGYFTPGGELVESVHYSAYGIPVFEVSGDVRAESAVGSTLLFQGAWYDDAAGLYQFGERNLHPVIGRFLQRDSRLFQESLALYTAFNGDPAGRVDPLGGKSFSPEVVASLQEFQGKASDLKDSASSLVDALNKVRSHDKKRTASDLGLATADFLSKLTALSATGGDEVITERAKAYTTFLDQVPLALNITKEIEGISSARKALNAFEASTWKRLVEEVPAFSELKGDAIVLGGMAFGASDSSTASLLGGASAIAGKAGAYQAFGDLSDARSEFLEKREDHMLAIGRGVHAIGQKIYQSSFAGAEHTKSAMIASGVLNTSEKLFGAIDAYRIARKNDDVIMMIFNQKSHGFALLVKEGRNTVSAAFDLGFEAGKLIAIAVSDPDTAAAYKEAVKQFEEDGGWLTVAGGILSTFGQDEAAFAIQRWHDFDKSQLIKPFMDELQRQHQRTEFYLNGLSAP